MNTDKNMKVVNFWEKKKKSQDGAKGQMLLGCKIKQPEISFRTDAASEFSELRGCMVTGPGVEIQCNRFEGQSSGL